MGKHKNGLQEGILLRFMESHKEIATGFVKGDKVATDQLWAELVEELNSHGPPSKNVQGWKKVWIDWKAIVRKKIAHNNSEARATGGGPFNKYVLTAQEDCIGQLCGIFKVVRGIEHTVEVGQPCSNDTTEDELWGTSTTADTSANTTADATADATTSSFTRKRRHQPILQESTKKFEMEQTQVLKNVEDILRTSSEVNKEHLSVMRDIKCHIDNVSQHFQKFGEILQNFGEESKRHNLRMEELRKEELDLKREELKLKKEKIDFSKSRMD